MNQTRCSERLIATLYPPVHFVIYHFLVLVVTLVSTAVKVVQFLTLPLKYILRSSQSTCSATEHFLIDIMGDVEEEEVGPLEDDSVFRRLSWSIAIAKEAMENEIENGHARPSFTRARSLSPKKSLSERVLQNKNGPLPRTSSMKRRNSTGSFVERRTIFEKTRSMAERIKSEREFTTLLAERRKLFRKRRDVMASYAERSKLFERSRAIAERIKLERGSFTERSKFFERSRSIAERIKAECSRDRILRGRSDGVVGTI